MRIRRKRQQPNSQTTLQPQRRSEPPAQIQTEQTADLSTLQQQAEQSGRNFGDISIFSPEQSAIPIPLQAKLTIGQPNDKYEQEADRVAADVVQNINSPEANQPLQKTEESEVVQAKPLHLKANGATASAAPPQVEKGINSAQGRGQPLIPNLQQKMGHAMGADFSGVRVHTDHNADQLNQSIQAKAFTTGRDVFFKRGAYQPNSRNGQELIAHELTHVVQQSGEINRRFDRRGESNRIPITSLGKTIQRNPEKKQYEFQVMWNYFIETKQTIERNLAKNIEIEPFLLRQLEDVYNWAVEENMESAITQIQELRQKIPPQDKAKAQAQDKAKAQESKTAVPQIVVTPPENQQSNGSRPNSLDLSKTKASRPKTTVPQIVVTPPEKQQSDAAKPSSSEVPLDVIDSISDGIASGGGITGDYADVNLPSKPNEYKGSDYMDHSGGASLNNQHFDIAESANLGLGGVNFILGRKDIKQGDKLRGAAKLSEGGGQLAHGGTKLAKGIALSKGGDSTSWTQVGDVGAGIADLGGTIASIMSFVQNGRDEQEKQQQGGLTATEKRDIQVNKTVNFLGAAQSGVNTVKDVVKVVGKVGGSPSEAVQHTVSGLARGAAAIGVVVGSIQIIHGAIQTAEASAKRGEILDFKKSIVNAIFKVQEDLKKQQANLPQVNLLSVESNELQEKLQQLSEAVSSLKAIYQEYAPTLDAMNKIQNRRMEQSKMKMAQGTVGVVSGALALSGVGAPIAIGVAAIGGILALGNVIVNWRRNAASDRLTTLASKIGRSGIPRPASDEDSLSYREMERRIYKCYYQHLPDVIKQKETINNLEASEFWDVKNFGWGDKKSRLGSTPGHPVSSFAEVRELDEVFKKENWIEVRIRKSGTDEISEVYKEKPKNINKVHFKLSASAHKSQVATEVSADIIAEALYNIGMASYNAEKEDFETRPIIPHGSTQGADMAQLESQTSNSLLKIADINPQRWKAWLESSNNGNLEIMMDLIKNQILGKRNNTKQKVRGTKFRNN